MTTEWNDAINTKPPFGIAIILGNEEWVDEDFNLKGVREGYYQEGEGYMAAVWNDYQDCWETQLVEPTMWTHFPEMPL